MSDPRTPPPEGFRGPGAAPGDMLPTSAPAPASGGTTTTTTPATNQPPNTSESQAAAVSSLGVGSDFLTGSSVVDMSQLTPQQQAIIQSIANQTQTGLSNGPNGPTLTEMVNGQPVTLSFNTAQDIIDSALQVVGLDPSQIAASGVNAGQTLTQFFWNQIVSQGIVDPTTIGEMVSNMLPATGQFQQAFPGYQKAIQSGYVRNVAQYVSAEEGITAVMLQGGVPHDMINPGTIGDLIAQGVSTNEVAQRVQAGYDAALNSPAEVRNYFAEQFGANSSDQALAQVFLNPNLSDVDLQKMLAGAQVRGAAAASNLTISQGLSQRLADMGETYADARNKFNSLTQQAGLFQQTVGEHNTQTPVAGTTNQNTSLTESQQGVEAAFGLNANASQQVHNEALQRENEFRGGGGAAQTQTEGFTGMGQAKPE